MEFMSKRGHSPVLVFADGDVERAAELCARGKFRNCGQVCISASRFFVIGGRLAASGGTCPVMGTASTMACLAEVLGLSLSGGGGAGSGSGERLRIALQTGRRAGELAAARLAGEPVSATSSLLTRASLLNAVAGLLPSAARPTR